MATGDGGEPDGFVRDWGTTRLADVLRRQLRDAWAVMARTIDGLTDEEYFWEPVEGCWGVRRRAEAKAPLVWGRGDWVVENSWDPPSPAPVTTIGWRMLHGYDCLNDFVARGLHLGRQDWNAIDVPGDAEGAVRLITDLVVRIDAALGGIDDEQLHRPAENDKRPAWAAVTFGFLEATHHYAEVGVLRDLFRTSWQRR